MNDDLGEFVGKGFALLRDRLKAVEARKPINGVDGDDAVVDYEKIRLMLPAPIPGKDGVVDYAKIEAMIPDPVKGDDAVVDYDKIRLMIPNPIPGKDGDDAVVDYARIEAMIPDPIPGQDAVVDYAKIRAMIPPPVPGKDATATDGKDGVGVDNTSVDKRGHLIVTLTDGRKIDAGKVKGKDGSQFHGMVAGGPSAVAARPSGVASIDFGDASNVAQATITGVTSIAANSIIQVDMRIEATPDHPINDLLIDPIRVAAYQIVAGVGFTIYGTMVNATAHGKYLINWSVV